MKAQIKTQNEKVVEREVSSFDELDQFLQSHGLLRSVELIREDLHWDGVVYFSKDES